jgi:hypothetical protein
MVTRQVRYSITDKNVSVNYDGETHIISRTDPLAEKLIEAVRNDRKDEIPDLVSASKKIETFGQGNFKVDAGQVFVNGVAVPDFLSRKILRFIDEKLPHMPLVKFAENLQRNPSFRAVNELSLFLDKNDHPLTDDGHFIAYKRVRADFTDIHSGTFDNHPGCEPFMPRNQVNEDPTQTCSDGLHVANWDYAHNHFASCDPATDIMLEVQVNPEHVVSVPIDYNNSKMRVCKYLVLGVVNEEKSSVLRNTAPVPQEEEEEDEEYCGECDHSPCWCECEDCGEDPCCCDEEEDDYCENCDHEPCRCVDVKDDEDQYPYKDELDEEE